MSTNPARPARPETVASPASIQPVSPIDAPARLPDYWVTPNPSYPNQALALKVAGSGRIRVNTDSRGIVVRAVMEEGIHPTLDAHCVAYAKSMWRGPANSFTTVSVSFALP